MKTLFWLVWFLLVLILEFTVFAVRKEVHDFVSGNQWDHWLTYSLSPFQQSPLMIFVMVQKSKENYFKYSIPIKKSVSKVIKDLISL